MRRALIDTWNDPVSGVHGIMSGPATRNFIDTGTAPGGVDFLLMPPTEARAVLTGAQSAPIGKPGARIEDMILPVGPGQPQLRELIIGVGASGCAALYRHEPAEDAVYVLAFRHQRESGYRYQPAEVVTLRPRVIARLVRATEHRNASDQMAPTKLALAK
jgi:hypothetical protein